MFEHPLPSAYSSTRFAEYMSNMKNIRCVVTGFSLDETILSTVVDGFHRGHRYQVVSDAVACGVQGIGDAASYQLSVVNVDRQLRRRRGERRPDRSQCGDFGLIAV